MSPRVVLTQISPSAWQHPAERSASTRRRRRSAIPGERTATDAFRKSLLVDAVRVGPAQRPQLYGVFVDALQTLDWPPEGSPMPELYVAAGPAWRTGAFAGSRPFIVLSARHVDMLEHDEQRFLVGRAVAELIAAQTHPQFAGRDIFCGEFGHWTPFDFFPFSTRGGERLVASEMSADRGGLLASQDAHAALMTFLKFAGGLARDDSLSVEAYIDQLEEAAGESTTSSPDATGDTTERDHFGGARLSRRRRLARRALDLHRWSQSAEYSAILAGTYMRRGEEPVEPEPEANASGASEDFRTDARAAVDSVGDVIDRAADSIGSAVNRAADSLGDVFNKSGESVGDIFNRAADAFRDAFKAAESAARAAEERMEGAWRDVTPADPVTVDYESPASETEPASTPPDDKQPPPAGANI